jgi:hypothetical protein
MMGFTFTRGTFEEETVYIYGYGSKLGTFRLGLAWILITTI